MIGAVRDGPSIHRYKQYHELTVVQERASGIVGSATFRKLTYMVGTSISVGRHQGT